MLEVPLSEGSLYENVYIYLHIYMYTYMYIYLAWPVFRCSNSPLCFSRSVRFSTIRRPPPAALLIFSLSHCYCFRRPFLLVHSKRRARCSKKPAVLVLRRDLLIKKILRPAQERILGWAMSLRLTRLIKRYIERVK